MVIPLTQKIPQPIKSLTDLARQLVQCPGQAEWRVDVPGGRRRMMREDIANGPGRPKRRRACYHPGIINDYLVSSMKNRLLTFVLLTIIPGFALAQNVTEHRCTYGELSRRVTIVFEPGMTVPCEVHYYKDSEAPGEQQVLWRAVNEEGYCEAKVEEFLAKLTGWGWSCSDAEAGVAAPEQQPDDTDALAPADSEDEGDAATPEA